MEILPDFREWSAAAAKLFSAVESLPDSIPLEDVDFHFIPPEGSRIRCEVIINGKTTSHISFEGRYFSPKALADWFERILHPIQDREICPEFLDIHCNGERARLIIVHSGWETIIGNNGKGIHGQASLFAIHYRGENKVRLWCFCETRQFVARLYLAIINALDSYSDFFNNKSIWPSHSDFQRRVPLSAVEQIKQYLLSNSVKGILEYNDHYPPARGK